MATVAYLIAAFSTIGGLIGFLKSGSKASIIAGGSFGVLYLLSASLIRSGDVNGARLATIASLVLVTVMGKKAMISKAPVPVLMTSLGFVGLFTYASKCFKL
jgi:uncharacterized membrane protein (UPF0136 family)